MNNNSKKLFLGLIVSVIAFVSGISYAYFAATIQNLGVRETSITLAELGSLKLTASEATYTSGGQYPGDMAIQKIVVEPVNKGVGIYEIDLNAVVPSEFGSDVEIKLYKSLDNTEVTITEGDLTQSGTQYTRVDTLNANGLIPVYEGVLQNGENILYQEDFEVINQSGLKVRENSSSTAYAKYTFYLVYIYKNNGRQNAQMGKTFSGTVSGKIIQEKTPSESHVVSFVLIDYDANCSLRKASFENHELVSWVAYDCDTLQEIGPITEGYVGGLYTNNIEQLVDGMFYETSYYYDDTNPGVLAIDDVRSLDSSELENYYSMWETDQSYESNLDALANFNGDLVLYYSEYYSPIAEPYVVTFVNLVGEFNSCSSVLKVEFDENGDPVSAHPVSCDTGDDDVFDEYNVYEVLENETDDGSKGYYYDPEAPDSTIDFTDSSEISSLISNLDNYAYSEFSNINFGIGESDYTLYHIIGE